MNKNVKKLLLPNLPYALIGGAVGQLSSDIPWLPWHPLIVGLLSAVLFRGIVWLKGKNAKKYRKDREYGSARWGTEKDIKPYVDPKPQNNIILTETELAVMDGGKCILQIRGERPFFSKKYDLKKHANYKYLIDYDKRNIFDTEEYLSTRLRLKANDIYEVMEVDLVRGMPSAM